MSERVTPLTLGQQDPAGEPAAALVGLTENHPHHAALLWGEKLRCITLSRPLRRYFAEAQSCDPAQGAVLLEGALHDAARRVLHAGSGEVLGVRLLGQVVEGVQLCPAGLGGVLALLPSLPDVEPRRQGGRETATLRGILDALPLPLVVAFGPRGEDRLLNAAARKMLRASERDEPPGESLFAAEARWGTRRGDGSLMPEEAFPLRRALRHRETVMGIEVSFTPHSGDSPPSGEAEAEERVYLESAAPILGHGMELLGAVAVFQEITEQKRADRQKDQFLALAGYELRTPLTVLRTQTQLISRFLDELPADQVRQVAEGIDQQTERLSLLVDDLLDVGRLATGNVEIRAQAIDLSQLCADVVGRARAATGQHQFDLQVAQPEVLVLGDVLRVEQVLGNLLANAQRQSPPGTKISVLVSRADDSQGHVSVQDHGLGVPEAERERIFERFHQAERASRGDRAGLGLGLWISRKLIELMGGRIWVDSEGHGATFTFQLPGA